VLSALETGRSPVIITERKDHVDTLAERLSRSAKNVIVLRGGMGIRERRAALQALAQISDDEERVLVATGRYLGEGFDDARLDTLILGDADLVAWSAHPVRRPTASPTSCQARGRDLRLRRLS
jgi:superfamily II DNA/RNA helicase